MESKSMELQNDKKKKKKKRKHTGHCAYVFLAK